MRPLGWQRWSRFALVLAWSGHFLLRAHDFASFADQDQFERDVPPMILRVAALLIAPASVVFLISARGAAWVASVWTALAVGLGLVASAPGSDVPLTLRGFDTVLLVLASIGLAAHGLLRGRVDSHRHAAPGGQGTAEVTPKGGR